METLEVPTTSAAAVAAATTTTVSTPKEKVTTGDAAVDTGDAERNARAERVAGLINAIMANPSLTALQQALGDPEIMAAAQSNAGVAVLVGFLTGGISEMQAKELLVSGKQNQEEMVAKLAETIVTSPSVVNAAAQANATPSNPEVSESAAAAIAGAAADKSATVATAAAVAATSEKAETPHAEEKAAVAVAAAAAGSDKWTQKVETSMQHASGVQRA